MTNLQTRRTKPDLDELIRDTGLKMEYVAKEMGMTANAFWKRRQNPRKRFDTDEMERLAGILNVPIEKLFEAMRNTEVTK